MSTTYSEARSVRVIAERLIQEHHRHLDKSINPEVEITYLFVDLTPEKNGKTVLGTCRRFGSLPAYLCRRDMEFPNCSPMFAIIISQECWNMLDEAQREALVDHELSHAGVEFDEKGNCKIVIKAHDIEEFSDIVERHGLWKSDVQQFVDRVMAARDESPSLFKVKGEDSGMTGGVESSEVSMLGKTIRIERMNAEVLKTENIYGEEQASGS